jgi:hypothetical protein
MASRARILFVFVISIPLVLAKVEKTYYGIATDGVPACLHNSNFTFD